MIPNMTEMRRRSSTHSNKQTKKTKNRNFFYSIVYCVSEWLFAAYIAYAGMDMRCARAISHHYKSSSIDQQQQHNNENDFSSEQ